MNLIRRSLALVLAGSCLSLLADGPADNLADKVRPVPPPGIAIPEEIRQELQTEAARFGEEVNALQAGLAARPALRARWADVAVFHKSVDWALRYNEFFRTNEIVAARDQLKLGRARLDALKAGGTPWSTNTGPTVRGYESRIDGSVQPYGLVVPASWTPNSGRRWRRSGRCRRPCRNCRRAAGYGRA